jgi:hypothetical protein
MSGSGSLAEMIRTFNEVRSASLLGRDRAKLGSSVECQQQTLLAYSMTSLARSRIEVGSSMPSALGDAFYGRGAH